MWGHSVLTVVVGVLLVDLVDPLQNVLVLRNHLFGFHDGCLHELDFRFLPWDQLLAELLQEVDLIEDLAPYLPSTSLVRAEALAQVGGFREGLEVCEDGEIFGRLRDAGYTYTLLRNACACRC